MILFLRYGILLRNHGEQGFKAVHKTEEIGKGKGERGKWKAESGKRKEERGKRKAESGKRK